MPYPYPYPYPDPIYTGINLVDFFGQSTLLYSFVFVVLFFIVLFSVIMLWKEKNNHENN